VGAATEVEQKARQHKTEDALAATRAAIEEGIVPGGGVALLRALRALEEGKVEGEEKIGTKILKRALEEPIRQIAHNAGKDGSVIAAEVLKNEGNYGYNALDDRYENLMEAGIVDPTKVVRSALENAVSAASMLLTTECVVADIPEEKKEKGGMPGAGMDMGY
jgi:chaperonin GroEL